MLKNYLIVAFGGAIGSVLRYGLNNLAYLHQSSSYLNTFFINIVGSFLIGLVIGKCESGTFSLFVTIGICGGFTTFSTFSMQSVTLLQQGKYGLVAMYIAGTFLIGILFAFLGFLLGKQIWTIIPRICHVKEIVLLEQETKAIFSQFCRYFPQRCGKIYGTVKDANTWWRLWRIISIEPLG